MSDPIVLAADGPHIGPMNFAIRVMQEASPSHDVIMDLKYWDP